MSHTILLYGATGYSGRLIARHGEAMGLGGRADRLSDRLVLAGRDGQALSALADELDMAHRVFSLADQRDVERGLEDVDVVINAAGPFAFTAERLAKAALRQDCHYVDINGEVDVYRRLDDLTHHAAQRGRAIVCSAGYTAAASDVLLAAALGDLAARSGAGVRLGAIRIALARVSDLSRGSALTLLRSLREQVAVVRTRATRLPSGDVRRELTLWHERVGRLERTFDFRYYDRPPRRRASRHGGDGRQASGDGRDLRIASAANLVDTSTAWRTVLHSHPPADSPIRIESYVEAGPLGRLAYQAGALLAPFSAIPGVADLARLPIELLPEGPTPQERRSQPQIVLLEIEDSFQQRLIDWGWHTPNPYDFTARVVVDVARRVAGSDASGWRTPSSILTPTRAVLEGVGHPDAPAYVQECRLDVRDVLLREGHGQGQRRAR